MKLLFPVISLVTLLSCIFQAVARCPNWCNQKGQCMPDDFGGYCYCDMGYTGEDCSQRICPWSFDPVRPLPIDSNANRRTVRLISSLSSGRLSGSLEFSFAGSSVTLPADAGQLSSADCSHLLKGLRSAADISCQRESFDSTSRTGSFLIKLHRYPTKSHTNNILSHDGNPPLSLFACNASKADPFEAQSPDCTIEDVLVSDLPIYAECSQHGTCDRRNGSCVCVRGFRGVACDDIKDDKDINVIAHDGPYFTGNLQHLSLNRDESRDFHLLKVSLAGQRITALRGDRVLAHAGDLVLDGGHLYIGESLQAHDNATAKANVLSQLPGRSPSAAVTTAATAPVPAAGYHLLARTASEEVFSVDATGQLSAAGALSADAKRFRVINGTAHMLKAEVAADLNVQGHVTASSVQIAGSASSTLLADGKLHVISSEGEDVVRLHAKATGTGSVLHLMADEERPLLTASHRGAQVFSMASNGSLTLASLQVRSGGVEVVSGGLSVAAGGLSVKGGLSVQGTISLPAGRLAAAGIAAIEKGYLLPAITAAVTNASYIGSVLDIRSTDAMEHPEAFSFLAIRTSPNVDDTNAKDVFRVDGRGTIHSAAGAHFKEAVVAAGGLLMEKTLSMTADNLSPDANGVVTIPLTSHYVKVTSTAATAISLVFAPGSTSGRLCVVSNDASVSTTGDLALPAHSTVLVVFDGVEWKAMQAPSPVVEDLRGVKTLTAANDLHMGNHSLSLYALHSAHIPPGHVVFAGRTQRLTFDGQKLMYVKGVLSAPGLRANRLEGDLDAQGHRVSNAHLLSAKLTNAAITASSLTFADPSSLLMGNGAFTGGVAFVDAQGHVLVSPALKVITPESGQVQIALTDLFNPLNMHSQRISNVNIVNGNLTDIHRIAASEVWLTGYTAEGLAQSLAFDRHQVVPDAGELEVSRASAAPTNGTIHERRTSYGVLLVDPYGKVLSGVGADMTVKVTAYSTPEEAQKVWYESTLSLGRVAMTSLSGNIDGTQAVLKGVTIDGGSIRTSSVVAEQITLDGIGKTMTGSRDKPRLLYTDGSGKVQVMEQMMLADLLPSTTTLKGTLLTNAALDASTMTMQGVLPKLSAEEVFIRAEGNRLLMTESGTGKLIPVPGCEVNSTTVDWGAHTVHSRGVSADALYLRGGTAGLLGRTASSEVAVVKDAALYALKVEKELVLEYLASGTPGGLLSVTPQGTVTVMGAGGSQTITLHSLTASKIAVDALNANALTVTSLTFQEDSSTESEGSLLLRDDADKVHVADGLHYTQGRLHVASIGALQAEGRGPQRLVLDSASMHTPVLTSATIDAVSVNTAHLVVQGRSEVQGDGMYGGTLTVRGAVVGSGPYVDSSDRRLKTNIQPLKGALDAVMGLQAVRYHLINSTTEEVGWIAQDVAKIIPELVIPLPAPLVPNATDTYFGVSYGRACVVAAEAVKELKLAHDAELQAIRDQMEAVRASSELAVKQMQQQLQDMQSMLAVLLKK